MRFSQTIRWKAFLLLVTFTANFFVVCRCSAHAASSGVVHSCCMKMAAKQHPCEKGGCPAKRSVQFNLLEKQVAASVAMDFPVVFELPRSVVSVDPVLYNSPVLVGNVWLYKHAPPPDFLALYQCFLI